MASIASHRFNNDLRYRDADHPSQTQFTPEYVLAPVRDALGGTIGLDPCTTADNPVAATRFYTPVEDGLNRPWFPASSVFVNPPYSKAREPWVDRCIRISAFDIPVILLIPAATETRIFQRAAKSAHAVVFIQGRVKFGVLRPNRRQVASSHPSALLCWHVNEDPLTALGIVMATDSGSFLAADSRERRTSRDLPDSDSAGCLPVTQEEGK